MHERHALVQQFTELKKWKDHTEHNVSVHTLSVKKVCWIVSVTLLLDCFAERCCIFGNISNRIRIVTNECALH